MDYETAATRDKVTAEPSHRMHRNEEAPPLRGQPYGGHPHRSAVRVSGEYENEGRDQSRSGRVSEIDSRGTNAKESELRQLLHNIEQGRDQVVAHDPGWALKLEGEVRKLAHVIDDIQGNRKPLSLRIILDDKSPLLEEIMGIVIPMDFHFPDLKYSKRSDPLVHIERFNYMTGVQGLILVQRCSVFPLTLEGRAR